MSYSVRRRDLVLRGVRVRCTEAGAGPPIVLVHGLCVSHKEWLGMLPEMAANFRCILPDLPGFGASEKPTGARYLYTREGFAETLRELFDVLELDPGQSCGPSMAGGAAI